MTGAGLKFSPIDSFTVETKKSQSLSDSHSNSEILTSALSRIFVDNLFKFLRFFLVLDENLLKFRVELTVVQSSASNLTFLKRDVSKRSMLFSISFYPIGPGPLLKTSSSNFGEIAYETGELKPEYVDFFMMIRFLT